MADIYEQALKKHKEWKGKIATSLKAELKTRDDLSLAYTPGVAAPCMEINKNPETVYDYTWKNNLVAVITDGSAVLGLGNIGSEAGLPVMEGKCCLFKQFGGVDAVPICLDTQDPDEIIRTVKNIAPSFGGINLEDIKAPGCVKIERELINALDIPVFHDDQHGTAIVVTAGLINAFKLVNKKPEDITAVVSGAGAAGSSIIKMIKRLGVKEVFAFNSKGILRRTNAEQYNEVARELAEITNHENRALSLTEALREADVFIGVSAPNLLTREMVAGMKKDSIVFAMANPEPEINYDDAKKAGARVVGTGRSDFPNQINNVLAFPGLFRGALDCRAKKITEDMKMAAAVGIANLVTPDELAEDMVIPSVFNPQVASAVAEEVKKIAQKTGISSV